MALKRHSDAAEMPNKDTSPLAAEVRRIVLDYANFTPRSVQTTIGPSQSGNPCERAIVYQLTGQDVPGGDSNPWLPLVGTAVHTEMAHALEQENRRLGRQRWLIEQRVEISDEIPHGTGDAFDTDDGEVIDWKVVGKTTLDSVRLHGSKQLYVKQLNQYGLGYARMGYQVNKCTIVYLPRNANPSRPFLDEMRVDSWDFDLDDAVDTVQRMRRLKKTAAGISPATRKQKIELVPANPSKDHCFFCVYKSICTEARK
jgi:hypothetical protein